VTAPVRDRARLNPPWPPDGRNPTESSMTAITDLTPATKEFYRAYRVAQVTMERAGFAGWPKAQASYERWFLATTRPEGFKAKHKAEAEGSSNRDVLNAIITACNAAADEALA
jgi:hypothetical protein